MPSFLQMSGLVRILHLVWISAGPWGTGLTGHELRRGVRVLAVAVARSRNDAIITQITCSRIEDS